MNKLLSNRMRGARGSVIAILCWVQTRAEWDNVRQRMTAFGEKTPEDSHAHGKRLLNRGIEMRSELAKIEARLKFGPARSDAVVMNDSFEYRMYATDSP